MRCTETFEAYANTEHQGAHQDLLTDSLTVLNEISIIHFGVTTGESIARGVPISGRKYVQTADDLPSIAAEQWTLPAFASKDDQPPI
jgi:hypothetical protein